MVEILPEFRAWFLGMDETDFTPFADQVGKYAQERTLADIKVLYVGSPDPKMFFHVCNAGYDFLEVRFVCMRFLRENPWQRLREIKKVCKKTPLQMLFRGQNILGYKHYPASAPRPRSRSCP